MGGCESETAMLLGCECELTTRHVGEAELPS
jgi:hypothetical protein